jgi:hypothetical protein
VGKRILLIEFGGACILQSVCTLDVDASFLNISATNSFFKAVGGAGAHMFATAQAIVPSSDYLVHRAQSR